MAGIGFRLREMAQRRTFSEWLKLYTYAALVFSGPWIVSILGLTALSIFAMPALQDRDIRIFTVVVVYVHCFSLIATGLIQLVVTRYVSDRFYLRNPEAVVPAFLGSLATTVLFQTVTGAIALYFLEFSFLQKVVTLGLYVTISVVWIEMLFLSAAKDYANIVAAFAIGYLTSFLLALVLSRFFGLDGLSVGFLMGQVLLLMLLMHRIFAEYRFGMSIDFKFLGHLRRYPALALVGVTYNLAIWVDKILFWHGPDGVAIHSWLRTHFPYDSAMFLAYLTLLPTLAIFLLRIETDFYVRYKSYYGTILQRAPLDLIEQRKQEMLKVLRESARTVLIWQGATTTLAFLVMPFLVSLMGIDPQDVPVFRVATAGAFFHGGLMILLILILYFDFRGSALLVSTVFLGLNAGLTWATLHLGREFQGFGYLGAAMVSMLLALVVFRNRVRNLEYLTFMRQPVR